MGQIREACSGKMGPAVCVCNVMNFRCNDWALRPHPPLGAVVFDTRDLVNA